jgi:hypothetical protein
MNKSKMFTYLNAGFFFTECPDFGAGRLVRLWTPVDHILDTVLNCYDDIHADLKRHYGKPRGYAKT